MPVQHARKRQSTVDIRRYDAAFVVVAVPSRGPYTDDEMAPPVLYRVLPRRTGS